MVKVNTTTDEALLAGIRLHDFIRANAGETAEWPLQISASEPETLETLDKLMREFREAAVRALAIE